MGMSLGSVPSTQTPGGSSTPGGSAPLWPKTIAGVTIPEEDKDKMILKIKVKNSMQLIQIGISKLMSANPIEIEHETGEKDRFEDLYYPVPQKTYSPGEYIVKIKNISDIEIGSYNNCDIEILQWGKIAEKNEENYIVIHDVSKIYEPEPDKIPIRYENAKFTEIPEWLFDKKVRSTVMSTFKYCTDLTSIPEGLFKNNVNAINFEYAFYCCKGLTSIPEGLFKYNTNVNDSRWTFITCNSLNNIPDEIIEYAKQVEQGVGTAEGIFYDCTSASNYNSLPSYMKRRHF